ncbi:Putative holocytochrome-c1 synthase [Cladobotryum mycophilum]|uniref:Holocytochrome c-type synthase n=1 Tax=Cladobotryum mycophilum TaxID=491253 RepID=A0ABR0SCR4_9HYPO
MTTEDACPVDHKTRDAWLEQARAAEASRTKAIPPLPRQHVPSITPNPSNLNPGPRLSHPTSGPPSTTPSPASHPITHSTLQGLETDRVTSSIPRSTTSDPSDCPVPHGASANPANHEIESGQHTSGNWVYPSEKMFFDAMKRKGYDARETDMKTVVPIHNAVNERAWKHIQEWEAPYLVASKCGGPKLESFANKNDRMTPTARINTILGYTAPFDRHDWVIDRCGTRVEYVIDFYAGRPGLAKAGVPSFYLDVRPKLNTWEGVKMRVMRWTGMA